MLGFGAIGQFAIGQVDTGAATGAEFIGPDKYWQPFSEPRRYRRGLAAYGQQTFAFQPTPIINIGWYAPFREPVRFKQGLRSSQQPYAAYQQPTPFVPFSWFAGLSEPVRVKPRLRAALNPFFFEGFAQPVLLNWFAPFSEPVRFKKGLRAQYQQWLAYAPNQTTITPFSWFGLLSEPVRLKVGLRSYLQRDLTRGEFIPDNTSAAMSVTELGDFLQAVLHQFNIPTHAYVDIIEKNPHHLGNLGIIENVAQSSIVASIVEPDPTFAAGTPVSTVAGARVAIILT